MKKLDDITYELRLLLGADRLLSLFEEHQPDNTVNYFKDSIYLHARSLYSFLYNNGKQLLNNNSGFNMTEYNNDWREPLNNYVMHVDDDGSRNGGANVVGGVHLNEKPHWFVSDIVRIWVEWIDNTQDAAMKVDLQKALDQAKHEAKEDYINLIARFTE